MIKYTPKPDKLIRHINSELPKEPHSVPVLKELQDKVDKKNSLPLKIVMQLVEWLLPKVKAGLALFITSPHSLHGRGVVTSSVTKITSGHALLITLSNLFNSLPVIQSFYISLSFLGVFAIAISLILGGVVNAIQNSGVSQSVAYLSSPEVYHSKRKLITKIALSSGLVILLGTNIIFTPLSFVASINVTAQKDISEMLAERTLEHIADSSNEFIALKEQEQDLVAREANCQDALQQITELGKDPATSTSNARYNLMLRFQGNKIEPPYGENSVCGRAYRDREAIQKLGKQARSKLVLAQESAAQEGLPAVAQLSTFFPDKYKSLFTKDGYIQDSATALAMSLEYSIIALTEGKSGQLIFPLAMLLLSTILSAASVLSVFSLSSISDIRMSYCPNTAKIFDNMCEQEREAIYNGQKK